MSEKSVTVIDITYEICPMTTVLVRIALDGLPPGGVLVVQLAGEEPHRNVAAAIRALGHAIVEDISRPPAADGAPRYDLTIRKSSASTSASSPSA
ncbi:sulfurtransferase TusA family protein [Acidomonas methanolica]|uniref:sulfurtransferase TusA family protein n=1 Tax=Acidomonas methanolica TaxID=437 RepID=UPI0010D03DA6|nr:sulfurtransferase TusA family protein [Acidomonas methanolica]TCS25646.1 TusA-related sulfurtransferase [Acidomonas methanolica]GEK99457.1 hypothetical protein AME01nite_19560 [Acidomonas methanolica NBRC 104435]